MTERKKRKPRQYSADTIYDIKGTTQKNRFNIQERKDGHMAITNKNVKDNWDEIKDRIFLVLERKNNPDAVMRPWNDLFVGIRMILGRNGEYIAAGLLGKDAVNDYGITEEEAFRQAYRNFSSTSFRIYDLAAFADGDQPVTVMPDVLCRTTDANSIRIPKDTDMIVATKDDSIYGSSFILCEDFLNAMHRELGDFYAILSSKHEIICIRSSTDGLVEERLLPVIRNINRNENLVEPEIRLSDSMYFYDGTELKVFES